MKPAEHAAGDERNPCIEYLQRAIAHLLMKNERMRFELFAIRQKISAVDRTLFAPGSRELKQQLPLHLLAVLRDLCRCEAAERETPGARGADSADNVLRIRGKHPGDPPQE